MYTLIHTHTQNKKLNFKLFVRFTILWHHAAHVHTRFDDHQVSSSTPCTLHPTPYTLHPAPYTLDPAPYTLNPTPYTPHPKP